MKYGRVLITGGTGSFGQYMARHLLTIYRHGRAIKSKRYLTAGITGTNKHQTSSRRKWD